MKIKTFINVSYTFKNLMKLKKDYFFQCALNCFYSKKLFFSTLVIGYFFCYTKILKHLFTVDSILNVKFFLM